MEPLVETTPVATPTPADDADIAALAGPAKSIDVDASLTDEQRTKLAEMKSALADVEVGAFVGVVARHRRFMDCKSSPHVQAMHSRDSLVRRLPLETASTGLPKALSSAS